MVMLEKTVQQSGAIIRASHAEFGTTARLRWSVKVEIDLITLVLRVWLFILRALGK